MAACYTPRVSLSETQSYALGWVVRRSPRGTVIWHDGGTTGFGAFVGLVPEPEVAVVILSNATNVGFPDAVGDWATDRILGNPERDYLGIISRSAKEQAETGANIFARPAHPQPAPPVAGLAGTFQGEGIGAVTVTVAGAGLVMALKASGALLALDPWDGAVFTVRSLAEGPLAKLAANSGPDPFAFAQYQIGQDGRLGSLKLDLPDGQAYVLNRAG